jgi:hypothetical protein
LHDLKMSDDGDLVPNWVGGLAESDGIAVDYADVNFRILTNDPDMAGYSLGANLEDLIGKPNVASTGKAGEASILRCLTFDGRFPASQLQVTSVPISESQIAFFVFFSSPTRARAAMPLFQTVVNLNS